MFCSKVREVARRKKIPIPRPEIDRRNSTDSAVGIFGEVRTARKIGENRVLVVALGLVVRNRRCR